MELKVCVNIREEWDIVGARQLGRSKSKEIGFGTVDQARIATAISELARNIYLYAKTGQIYFETVNCIDRQGLKIVAVDAGPGILDLSQAMQDGYSTSGGLGAGLPGVKRLMDTFEINTEWGKGTEVTVIKWVR